MKEYALLDMKNKRVITTSNNKRALLEMRKREYMQRLDEIWIAQREI